MSSASLNSISPAQERTWFLEKFEPGSCALMKSRGFHLSGPLDVKTLHESFAAVISSHDMLRTGFGGSADNPAPAIMNEVHFELRVEDLSALATAGQEVALEVLADAQATHAFDLARPPLLRAQVIKLATQKHLLWISAHALIVDNDNDSIADLLKKISAAYAALMSGAPPPRPAPVKKNIDRENQQRRALEYWKTELAGVEPLELPTDFPRTGKWPARAASLVFQLAPEVTAAVERLESQEALPPLAVYFAAFQLLLSRYTGQNDFIIGLEHGAGTLATRCRVSEDLSVSEFLRLIQAKLTANFVNQDLRLEGLSDGQQPLFSAQFSVRTDAPSLTLTGCVVEESLHFAETKLDLSLSVRSIRKGSVRIEYNAMLFQRETIELLFAHYSTLLAEATRSPERPLTDLPLLSASEKELMLRDWNATTVEHGADLTLVEMFEGQVAKTPDRIAVEFQQKSWTYRELNERANQLARWLRANGAGPDVLVGVFTERSLEMVLALYATLKAGAAYLPIEPGLPKARVEAIIADAQLRIVLTQQHLTALIEGLPIKALALDCDLAEVSSGERTNPELVHGPENLAYCIFTSGSTGRPKGVMINHRSIRNRLLWMQAEYRLQRDDRVLQKTPFGFDVSVWEFFWPLQVGATLVVLEPEMHRSSAHIAETITRAGITTLHFIPSMLSVFLEEPEAETCGSVRLVFCSGEAFPFALQARFFAVLPDSELHNLYGPTEAAVDITYWQCRKNDSRGLIPIGRPVWNSQVYVLDSRMRPVPRVAIGELYLGGVQLARGYLGRADLTAERFVPDPFSDRPGARLYKTGDLVRWLSDGSLEYLGRNDFQVKVNGLRIELGEIESVLNLFPGIRQSAVIVLITPSGGQQLACYLVKAEGSPLSSEQVRDHLKAQLPAYMTPQHIIWLASMPVSSNGKLDRKSLPKPAFAKARSPSRPFTEIEARVAKLWEDILSVNGVGLSDNFHALGGGQRSALELAGRLSREQGTEIAVRVVYDHPTLAQYCRYLSSEKS